MNQDLIIQKFEQQLDIISKVKMWELDKLIDVHSKTKMLLKNFLPESEYLPALLEIDTAPTSDPEYHHSVNKLTTILSTVVEEINLTGKGIIKQLEEQKEKAERELEMKRVLLDVNAKQERRDLLTKFKEAKDALDLDKAKLQAEIQEINNIKNRLLEEEKKLDDYKQKRELATNEINFNTQANANRKLAYMWASCVVIFIVLVILTLTHSLNKEIFLNLAKQAQENKLKVDENLIKTSLLLEYIKACLLNAVMISISIYALVFSVKNYNAHMHNYLVNSHKANCLSSTLSLLGTARSESGNDQLLLQATQAIFSHQRTGYSGKESEMFNPSIINSIIDTIKSKVDK